MKMKYFIGQRWRRMRGRNNNILESLLEIISLSPLKCKILASISPSKRAGEVVIYGSENSFIGENSWYFPLKNQDAI